MKRYVVLSAVSLASILGTAGGIMIAFDVQPDRFGEGLLILHGEQGKKCKDQGGCAILSPMEIKLIEHVIREDERAKAGKRSDI